MRSSPTSPDSEPKRNHRRATKEPHSSHTRLRRANEKRTKGQHQRLLRGAMAYQIRWRMGCLARPNPLASRRWLHRRPIRALLFWPPEALVVNASKPINAHKSAKLRRCAPQIIAPVSNHCHLVQPHSDIFSSPRLFGVTVSRYQTPFLPFLVSQTQEPGTILVEKGANPRRCFLTESVYPTAAGRS